jgi:hypothetical protein
MLLGENERMTQELWDLVARIEWEREAERAERER